MLIAQHLSSTFPQFAGKGVDCGFRSIRRANYQTRPRAVREAARGALWICSERFRSNPASFALLVQTRWAAYCNVRSSRAWIASVISRRGWLVLRHQRRRCARNGLPSQQGWDAVVASKEIPGFLFSSVEEVPETKSSEPSLTTAPSFYDCGSRSGI